MSKQPYPIRPYEEWSQERFMRWINAGNTFGAHLLQYVRDNAVGQMMAEDSFNVEQANRAVDLTLHTLMDLLDGYYRPAIDESHWAEYILLARIRDANNNVIETIELAPEGDGLAMGYAGWREGDFGQEA